MAVLCFGLLGKWLHGFVSPALLNVVMIGLAFALVYYWRTEGFRIGDKHRLASHRGLCLAQPSHFRRK